MKFENCCSSDDLDFLAEEIKRETFELDNFNINPYLFVCPSAYDTAWLAMIEDLNDIGTQKPMFQGCLDWVMNNQNVVGLWGNHEDETLTSTLACVAALTKWNIGSLHVHKGKRYIERNTERIIGRYHNKKGYCPRWFILMFTGLLELAQQLGIHFLFPSRVKHMINNLFTQRQDILHREKIWDESYNRQSLLAYLEVLPSTFYAENEEDIIESLHDSDGSLFQSPSATAAAFMLSRNSKCLAYLESLVHRCPHGVPQIYPLSEELIKLSMVNIMDNFGLGEYFREDINRFLLQTYKSHKNEDVESMCICSKVDQLHKASLEFRMLRMNGYDVFPRSFCWFLNDVEIQDHLEVNMDCLIFVILSVYRATDLMFPGEYELEKAREFCRKILYEQLVSSNHVKHEMSTPWMARLKHLDHRMWIEDKDSNAFISGKASSIRIYSEKLTHLASRSFELRQAIYRHEMEDVIRWAKKWGLHDIGFGREKATYVYFAASSSTSFPFETAASNVRKLMAKSGILITVADDFFDEEGSVDELQALTKAVKRWEGDELKGYGKIIFKALDNLVIETADTCRTRNGADVTNHLHNIWGETFESWLCEAEWSKKRHIPSMEEYLRNGMISIAAHTIVLPISCLMEACFPQHILKPGYDNITTLLMTVTRLLNDLQSYQKEQEQGKINYVLLHMKSHCGFEIKDSIAYIEKIIDSKRREFVAHVLMDGYSDLPKPCKDIHMSFCKVFEMFFNKKNRYDSDTEMLHDIKKALYDPINTPKLSQLDPTFL